MIRLKIALISGLLIVFAGCAMTGFVNTVDLSLNPESEVSAQLFEKWNSIAAKWDLQEDERESIPGKKVGYFGRPYHYYCLEMDEAEGKIIAARFVHEGRLASSVNDYIGPEKEFLEYIQKNLGPDIPTVEHIFAHEEEAN